MENVIKVQNLYPHVDASKLCDAFKVYGRILAANIEFDKEAKSLCKGFVCFDNYTSALSSVKLMNRNNHLGNPISIEMHIATDHFTKIYVKNLPYEWDECDLILAFRKFGQIKKSALSENPEVQRKFGFIEFKEHESARRAADEMNDSVIEGLNIIVERYKEKAERECVKQHSVDYAEVKLKESRQLNNLHVKNLPKDLKDRDLKRLFQSFGEILSCKVMEDEFSRSKGFGFVSFKKTADAEKAMRKMDNYSINSHILKVNFKENKDARAHFLQLQKVEDYLEMKASNYKKEKKYYSGDNLNFISYSASKKMNRSVNQKE